MQIRNVMICLFIIMIWRKSKQKLLNWWLTIVLFMSLIHSHFFHFTKADDICGSMQYINLSGKLSVPYIVNRASSHIQLHVSFSFFLREWMARSSVFFLLFLDSYISTKLVSVPLWLLIIMYVLCILWHTSRKCSGNIYISRVNKLLKDAISLHQLK